MVQSAGFGTYVFFAVMCCLAGFWAYFLVPETKNRSLEELSIVFKDNSAAEERELLEQTLERTRRSSAIVIGGEEI